MTTNDITIGMRCVALFLFAGLFAAATLQTANAQTKAKGAPGNKSASQSHVVTINVDKINELEVTGAPSITIDAADGLTTSNDAANETPASTTVTGALTITTNAQNTTQKITADATNIKNGTASNLGLKVEAVNSAPGSSDGPVSLLSVNDGDLESGNVVSGIQSAQDETSINLKYSAGASPQFDPGETTKVEVEYTLTSN